MPDIYSKFSLALVALGSSCFLALDYSWRNADPISPVLASKLASVLSTVSSPSEPCFSSPGGFGETEARLLFWVIALVLLIGAVILAHVSVQKSEQLKLSTGALLLSGAAFMFIHILVGLAIVVVSVVVALLSRSRLTSSSN